MTDKPKLPRVRPEGLEEGKRYLVRIRDDKTGEDFVLTYCINENDTPMFWELGVTYCTFSEFGDLLIWGPIPEFELEGE